MLSATHPIQPFAGSESTVECSSLAETTVSVAVPTPESAGEQQSATDNGAGYNQTETVNKGEADAKMARQMRQRGDIRAAQMMRMKDLWLNRDKRIVGAIPVCILATCSSFEWNCVSLDCTVRSKLALITWQLP
ncbi:hypothetical protein S245_011814 [Arachis hypogaea]